ncbi:MAG: hypothetical protein R6U85_11050 [Salinivirgaceae bacterium]
MKKLSIFLILLFFLTPTIEAQRDSNFERDRKQVFKKKKFGEPDKGSKGLPPDPGDGEGGSGIPISGGALLLGAGLAFYAFRNTQKRES